ncbi:hypothetical protein FDUTEX481_09267 [Tolypothrix sp. PCC 7601]|nr:hypothetical protein FDUTEX481_09267 [Tolypothrix sp. PCC 7601]
MGGLGMREMRKQGRQGAISYPCPMPNAPCPVPYATSFKGSCGI